jgi:hypothetical protein
MSRDDEVIGLTAIAVTVVVIVVLVIVERYTKGR